MTPLSSYRLLAFTVSTAPAEDWQSTITEILTNQEQNWLFYEQPLELEQVYTNAPLAGGKELPKYVVWSSLMDGGSAFVTNSMDGWTMLTRYVSRILSHPFFEIRVSNDLDQYPVCSMSLWQNGEQKRCIQVLKEQEWEFFQKGAVLPFEEASNYGKRSIPARFTKDICVCYLNKLGFSVSNQRFWMSNGPAFYGSKTMWD